MTVTGSFVNCSSHHQRNNPSRTKQDTSLDTGTCFTPSKNTEQMQETQDSVCVPEGWGGSLSRHQPSCAETEQPSGPSPVQHTVEGIRIFSPLWTLVLFDNDLILVDGCVTSKSGSSEHLLKLSFKQSTNEPEPLTFLDTLNLVCSSQHPCSK